MTDDIYEKTKQELIDLATHKKPRGDIFSYLLESEIAKKIETENDMREACVLSAIFEINNRHDVFTSDECSELGFPISYFIA